jgi:hypothetical protein
MRDCAPVAGVSSCFLRKELTFFGKKKKTFLQGLLNYSGILF